MWGRVAHRLHHAHAELFLGTFFATARRGACLEGERQEHHALLEDLFAGRRCGSPLRGLCRERNSRGRWQRWRRGLGGQREQQLWRELVELGLGNVRVVHARAEEHRDAAGYPCVVSRAVAALPGLLASVRHLLAPDGVLVAMKGREPASEIAALPDGATVRCRAVSVPGVDAPRHLVEVRP